MNAVQKAQRAAEQAERDQVVAWQRWQADEAAQAEWEAAVDRQRAVEAAVDRAEVQADRREAWDERQADRQCDWWVAAYSNARAA